ncbi:MAG TPA: hypothetical protein VGJ30_14100 [Candidatus Angelobacter sp.]|jgi:hypothetical protein
MKTANKSKKGTVTSKPSARKVAMAQRTRTARSFASVQQAEAYFFPRSKNVTKLPNDGKKAGIVSAEKRLAELENSFLP